MTAFATPCAKEEREENPGAWVMAVIDCAKLVLLLRISRFRKRRIFREENAFEYIFRKLLSCQDM